jgi:hypothetical protein
MSHRSLGDHVVVDDFSARARHEQSAQMEDAAAVEVRFGGFEGDAFN